MAKIFYNGNRIIVDGHAETAEECRAITAMCDSMANDENFKTIIYEEGHAVFEQISGGDSMMFAMNMNDYILSSKYNQEVGANYDVNKGTIAQRLDDIESELDPINPNSLAELVHQLHKQLADLMALIGTLPEGTEATTLVGYVDEKANKPEYKLPYTAAEIEEKLANL